MNTVFDVCVQIMIWFAPLVGLTYKELNVWLFVIIHPIVTFIFIVLFGYYRYKYTKLIKKI